MLFKAFSIHGQHFRIEVGVEFEANTSVVREGLPMVVVHEPDGLRDFLGEGSTMRYLAFARLFVLAEPAQLVIHHGSGPQTDW
jgi:hypothetical protein